MNASRIYHIADRTAWTTAPDPWRPDSLASDGFIHCSYEWQVGPTLRRFFSAADGSLPEELTILEIDPFRTEAVVRAEAGTGGETDLSGAPELFPHLYGALPHGAVTALLQPSRFAVYSIDVEGYTITDDRSFLSVDVATAYLSRESYWAQGRSRATVIASIENSWVLTLVAPNRTMAGMARVITDWATMYYLSDLFVLPDHRGRGLGKALVRTAVEYPPLADLKGVLRTADAHTLYEQFGFERDGPDSKSMRRRDSATGGLT